MRRAGLSSQIVRAFITMYHALRRIIVDGLAGETRRPRRCIPAGCPAVTTLLALLHWCWDHEIRIAVPDIIYREYVDDLTAGRERREILDDVVEEVQAMARVSQASKHDF